MEKYFNFKCTLICGGGHLAPMYAVTYMMEMKNTTDSDSENAVSGATWLTWLKV